MDQAFDNISADKSPKLAQKVAAMIERDIIRLGWPVGRNLGSEAEFVQRYGVGRWVVREAISIAVSDGLLEIRRGRSGGLLVAAPAEGAVITMIQNYMELSQVKVQDVLEARAVIEMLAMRLAANRVDLVRSDFLRTLAAGRLDEQVGQETLLHEVLLITGNIALYVFAIALVNVTAGLLQRHGFADVAASTFSRERAALRGKQIEAVIGDEIDVCHAVQKKYVALLERMLSEGSAADTVASRRKQSAAPATPGAVKASEVLIQKLLVEVARYGWGSDHNLGSEPELLNRYGISRETLREAIRRLERHGIVEMRQGRGDSGGLRVATPNPTATAKSAVLYLKYSKLPLDAVYDVQIALDLAVVSRIAALPVAQRTAIAEKLAELAAQPLDSSLLAVEAYINAYYLCLGDICGNAIFALFIRILAQLVTLDAKGHAHQVSQTIVDSVQTAAQRLASALHGADAATARRSILELRRIALGLTPRERSVEDIVAREINSN